MKIIDDLKEVAVGYECASIQTFNIQGYGFQIVYRDGKIIINGGRNQPGNETMFSLSSGDASYGAIIYNALLLFLNLIYRNNKNAFTQPQGYYPKT